MSQPPPVPSPDSRPVLPHLRDDLAAIPTTAPAWIAQALDARTRVGVERYGVALHTYNGRDPIQDLTEELLDALQYLAQARLEGRVSMPVYLPCLAALCAVLATIKASQGSDHA